MNVDELVRSLYPRLIDIGQKLIGALILWIIGRWVIGMIKHQLARQMNARKIDTTLIQYAESVTGVLLNIVLVIALLGIFGVQTTSFAAILAAAGLAVGTAWAGLLANFAAGAFLVILKPFKRGDFVTVAGVTGTVEEVGLFVTTVNTMDNIRTAIGNNKVLSETIQNFTANPFRRVDRTAQLAHNADHKRAIEILKAALARIPNVLHSPMPDVTILDFNLAGPVLAVRPYCHNDHYWQVYFDTNEAIRNELGAAGFAVPETHVHVNRT